MCFVTDSDELDSVLLVMLLVELVATEPVEWVVTEFLGDVAICFVVTEELPDVLVAVEPVEPETGPVERLDELDNVASVVLPVGLLFEVVADEMLELIGVIEDWGLDWDDLGRELVILSVRETPCVLTDDEVLETVKPEPDSVSECEETDMDDLCVECEIRPVDETVVETMEDELSRVVVEEVLVFVKVRPEDFSKVALDCVVFVVPLVPRLTEVEPLERDSDLDVVIGTEDDPVAIEAGNGTVGSVQISVTESWTPMV